MKKGVTAGFRLQFTPGTFRLGLKHASLQGERAVFYYSEPIRGFLETYLLWARRYQNTFSHFLHNSFVSANSRKPNTFK